MGAGAGGKRGRAAGRVRATLSSLVGDPDACADRVVPLAAELTIPGLELNQSRRTELVEQVDDVIDCAAWRLL